MDQQTAKTSAAAIVAGLKKAGIDFVASLPDEKMPEVIRAAHLKPCKDIAAVVAQRATGEATVAVLPQGPLTIPYLA